MTRRKSYASEGAAFGYTPDLSFPLSILYDYDGSKSLHMRCASGRGSIIQKAMISFGVSQGIHRLLDCTIDNWHILRYPIQLPSSPCLSASAHCWPASWPRSFSSCQVLLRSAHIDPEGLTLDRKVRASYVPTPTHLSRVLSPRISNLQNVTNSCASAPRYNMFCRVTRFGDLGFIAEISKFFRCFHPLLNNK